VYRCAGLCQASLLGSDESGAYMMSPTPRKLLNIMNSFENGAVRNILLCIAQWQFLPVDNCTSFLSTPVSFFRF
jgi:hypothetical protein